MNATVILFAWSDLTLGWSIVPDADQHLVKWVADGNATDIFLGIWSDFPFGWSLVPDADQCAIPLPPWFEFAVNTCSGFEGFVIAATTSGRCLPPRTVRG